MTPRIGRHGAARALIACASLGAVLMVAYVDTERTSPGPIARAHARIAELAEGTSCSACHGGWRTTMTSACLECHAPIAAQIESAGGLHGTLDAQAGRDVVRDPNACGRCHGEHHGDTFALVNARSFALAGVADPAQFDHARIGWAMTGRHAELACTECHTHADAAPLPEGAQRYLGLERSCASCHEDPHEGAFARSCAECHVQTTFAEHVPTGHEKHLPLTGAHGAASCRDCHAEESPHSLEVLAGGGARPPSRGCADCHASPHSAALLEGAARLAGAPRQKSCGACHASEHLAFRSLAATMSVAQHAFTGFNLEAPHTLAEPALAQPAAADSESDPAVGIACAACHDPALESFVERYPGRRPLDCAACHSDPHGGQFRDGAFADADLTGGGCVACHAPAGFAPHTFDLTQHAQAAFIVDGAHAALDCGACHVVPEAAGGAQRASAPPRRFNGTPSRCEACHADAHEGAFHARQAQLQANRAGTCAECHGTTRFDEAHGFQHGHFTGFALVGAHAESDCATCHAPEGSADALGRTFGRAALPDGRDARAAREDGPLTCAVCHADPHAGAFNARDAEVASGADCARCHGESSFRDMNDGFDHGHETGFALEGAHARAACSACHTPLEGADASGRTTARAAGTRCADCHADPHAGQFTRATPPLDAQSGQRKAPQTTGADCARCHSPRGAFAADSFEHEWDTNFPLDGAHAALACAACHRPEQWTYAGREVEGVRYRPLGMDCVDCHGEQAGALRRRVRGKGR